jgi:hypothetical protein
MDMGFTGNTFSDTNYTITAAGDGYLFSQGNAATGGNLVVATGNTGTTRDVVFSFGFLAANEFLRFQRSTNTILPYANVTANIGSTTKYINNLYAANHIGTTAAIGTLSLSGNTISSTDSIITIDPATSGSGGGVIIQGNLSVTGNVTYINSNNVTTNDLTINMANNAATAAAANGGGIEVGPAGSPYITMLYNSTSNTWVLSNGANVSGTLSASGNVTGGNITTAGVLTVNSGAAATAIVNGAGNAVGNIGSSTAYFNTIFGKATTAQYADLAENYLGDAAYEPGTVLDFDGEQEVTLSTRDSSRRVAGVVSTNPAHLMNSTLDGAHVIAVALCGRVPTQVTGKIAKGDLMVSAGNGRARAEANPATGTVIGKALENFDGGEGTIEIVISMQ